MVEFDLELRTLEFSKQIIRLYKLVRKQPACFNIGDQLMRSATSIGANYREANETDTKKDFRHRLGISKKEAKETIYWLQLLREASEVETKQIDALLKESTELMKILGAIYAKTN